MDFLGVFIWVLATYLFIFVSIEIVVYKFDLMALFSTFVTFLSRFSILISGHFCSFGYSFILGLKVISASFIINFCFWVFLETYSLMMFLFVFVKLTIDSIVFPFASYSSIIHFYDSVKRMNWLEGLKTSSSDYISLSLCYCLLLPTRLFSVIFCIFEVILF